MNGLHDFRAIAFVLAQMQVVLVVWNVPYANHDFLFLISCMVDYYPHYLLNEIVGPSRWQVSFILARLRTISLSLS